MNIRQVPQRSYEGEQAAQIFMRFLETLHEFPGKRDHYISLLHGLQHLESEAKKRGNLDEWWFRRRKSWEEFTHELYEHALQVSPWALDWRPDQGFVVVSASLRVHALLSLLELFRRGALGRLKGCRHCGSLFFARFKHQVFCSDPKKNCQWEHYHSSEWRRMHRVKNREHQANFRQGLFGKKGRR